MGNKPVKDARVNHEGIEYLCNLEHAKTTDGRKFWILDFTKLVVNDYVRSKHMMGSGESEADCLRCAPVGIKWLVERGLSVEKACDLVAQAIGGATEVANPEYVTAERS